MSVYAIVTIIRKHLNIEESLHAFLPIPNLTIFEKNPLIQVPDTTALQISPGSAANQLNRFDH